MQGCPAHLQFNFTTATLAGIFSELCKENSAIAEKQKQTIKRENKRNSGKKEIYEKNSCLSPLCVEAFPARFSTLLTHTHTHKLLWNRFCFCNDLVTLCCCCCCCCGINYQYLLVFSYILFLSSSSSIAL